MKKSLDHFSLKKCLNCGSKVDNNYCSVCSQKTDTHRLTPKHFFYHDILHGIWHLDKGILFTLKEAIVRPGQASLDYIAGKRARYYNVFYLCLLLLGISIILGHYYDEVFEVVNLNKGNALIFDNFMNNNQKILTFSFIPLFALNLLVLFRKSKFNFAECFIPSGMILLLFLIFNIVFTGISFLSYFGLVSIFVNFIDKFNILMMLIPIYVLIGTFKTFYSKWGLTWRIFLFYVLLFVELVIFMIFVFVVFYDGKNFEWYG